MSWPELPGSVAIDESVTELDGLWDRFEVFEALHHAQRICNPLDEERFARVIELLAPQGQVLLDLACGSGELLIRCHESGAVSSVGVDLSPWMLLAAHRESRSRLTAAPAWVLADAAKYQPTELADRVICLGGEWIWHGMPGTIAALAERVKPGGLVVYGGPRLHFDADPHEVSNQLGKLDTTSDVETRMAACGLRVIERLDPDEQGWLDYLERGRVGALEWQARHRSARSDDWVAAQREWSDHYAKDRSVVGWSVWVAESSAPSVAATEPENSHA